MSLPNFVRIVALFEGFCSAGLSMLTLHYFMKRSPPKAVRVHVLRVSLVYLAFVAYGAVEVTLHWGAPFRWQLFALMVVFALAAHAHVPLVRYERACAAAHTSGRRIGD